MNIGSSSSRRSWPSTSVPTEVWSGDHVFERNNKKEDVDDEEELKWAALERLPTFERLKKSIVKQVIESGRFSYEEVDISKLGIHDKNKLMDGILKTIEEDNEKFLLKMKERIQRVDIEIPKVEVRFEKLCVEGDAFNGSRALPTLVNSTMNAIEGVLGSIKLLPSKKSVIKILQDVSGIIRPTRLTLLLGPPGSGKTTLLQALAAKLDRDLRVSGKVTYCGHELSEFVPERTCAYISQHNLHHGEMTVKETLDFSGRCLGVGTRHDLLVELTRREKHLGIKPDPDIDAFMKATAMEGQETSLITDYVLKILGLEMCADTLVGDEMRRGISGGEKKRLTTGEMLVGPAKVFLMDEISTGLDSSTTFQIVSVTEFVTHFKNYGIGQQLSEELEVPYDRAKTHPAALVKDKYGITKLELFKACFAREWLLTKRSAFIYIFKTSQITIMSLIAMTVFLRTEMKYGQLEDGRKFYGALFFSLINIMFNGMAELAMTIFRLPVFFKQRDLLFYPAWAFALPIWILRIPLSFLESGLWVVLTYYTIGFAPAASRFFRQFLAFFCIHQMGLSLFRFIAALGRTQVVANTLGTFILLLVFLLGGFIIAKDDIEPWMIWGYYASPMMYGQNAIAINEFLDERWSTPNLDPRVPEPTVGKALLKARSMFTEDYWYWICVGALLGFSLLFNICFIVALTFLNPFGDSKSIVLEEENKKKETTKAKSFENIEMAERNTSERPILNATTKRGMVLPFRPLSLAFNHVNYYINMPAEMKKQGFEETRLQLLRDVSGAFRPGVLTALVGVTGAGKTTLMDVLAGRKTGGYIEGSISVSGYPKNQATFARISGYCEQNDIHSPNLTVYESIVFSAWLRLGKEINGETQKMFVEEVMKLVELHPVRNFLVGLPGIDGLSTEQRKRLTIAVELVANPSIIFMDEPTSGLDARAAAIVMRTVRNTANTGRTVVCTIHQPSIDIFESFDELLLMKRGGQIIYSGPLGQQSQKLVKYFEAISGIPKIKDGYNPATWMLEISSPTVESQLSVDFAELYIKSELYQTNQELIKELSTPIPGTKDLNFATKHSRSFITQCKGCFWKQQWSYWRNPQYNAIRFFLSVSVGVIFGLIFWQKGDKLHKEQDLMNLTGAMYSAILFLGATNTSSVQPVVAVERTVFYRERAAGMYSALPYTIAQVAIECIYVAIQTLAYTLILYSMIGFPWQADKFIWFYYFIFMSFVYFTLYGMMTVALTPNHQIAAIVMSFFLVFWNIFSGFVIPKSQIPIWWRWYYWACPTAWTVYGLVTSQLGDKETLIEVPGAGTISVKSYLNEQMGFEYDFLGVVAVAHIVFVVVFLFVFAYGIKVLNFQKR
ncbi:pleiotropic drug resistance protein [Trifolium repens]|nr:pleiotropic drug resistance protein [Trifolium repens]